MAGFSALVFLFCFLAPFTVYISVGGEDGARRTRYPHGSFGNEFIFKNSTHSLLQYNMVRRDKEAFHNAVAMFSEVIGS